MRNSLCDRSSLFHHVGWALTGRDLPPALVDAYSKRRRRRKDTRGARGGMAPRGSLATPRGRRADPVGTER